MNRGSCLCGDITWTIDGEVVSMANCHCSMCRKIHGGPFGTYLAVGTADFSWTEGTNLICNYESSPRRNRPFCPRCGSVVAFEMQEMNLAFMPAGNLEGDIERPLDRHIYVGSKAPWFEITDGVEQFEGSRGGKAFPEYPQPPRPPETPGAIGGSCLCGSVGFEFDEALDRMGYCHCSRCRKSRSSAHSAQLFVADDQFRWLRGDSEIRHYKVPEASFFTTSFCGNCASPMPLPLTGMAAVLVPAGALDQDPRLRPQAHIYVGSKAPWFEITDDLPRFEEMPDR